MTMKAHIYLRASTKDQDATRAQNALVAFASRMAVPVAGIYSENISGTKLQRPELMRLLSQADPGDVLLVESVDRLSRLSHQDWQKLKQILADKQLRLVVMDLPTTHQQADEGIAGQVMSVINQMLVDLMSTMARLDQQKRVERINEGIANKRALDPHWAPPGKQKNPELRAKVERLLERHHAASAGEIAMLAGCGVATVYRIKKEIQDRNKERAHED